MESNESKESCTPTYTINCDLSKLFNNSEFSQSGRCSVHENAKAFIHVFNHKDDDLKKNYIINSLFK